MTDWTILERENAEKVYALIEIDDIGRIDIREIMKRINHRKFSNYDVLDLLRISGYEIVWRPGITYFVCAKYKP